MRSFILLLCVYVQAAVGIGDLFARAGCNDGFTKCAPKGASSTMEPSIGPDLAPVYVDLVDSISTSPQSKRGLKALSEDLYIRAASTSLCCQKVQTVPSADNYTTNYFFPDSSNGQIVSGNYSTPAGATANLISGDYKLADGTSGNIYSGSQSSDKPNTATLPIPTQYTAAGSGSAIAATALGQVVTYTTTIPGTTVLPTTVSAATTVSTGAANGSVLSAPTTEAVSTVSGTTVSPAVSTVVTRLAASSTKKSAAARNENDLYAICSMFVSAAFLTAWLPW
ncbi:MAG: hypothetical protein OHK93_006710 [Ramalina farinacea]|uniref:Uncharacterized protein n=1 Tax=Ramalina farinacea TaxID=258253 RepID=A0AA43TUU0_9LECA|nr:hypothetical protein [Ramalina farinacea]